MEKEKLISKLEIYISGQVQGVGFRYFTLHRALELNIKGYVQNTWDGRVKIIAIASQKNIQQFIKVLQQGPRLSRVTDIETNELTSSQEYTNFRIKH